MMVNDDQWISKPGLENLGLKHLDHLAVKFTGPLWTEALTRIIPPMDIWTGSFPALSKVVYKDRTSCGSAEKFGIIPH